MVNTLQTDRIENLKRLINSSVILNSQERAEWLALLDLMNDKQFLELEKILGSRGQQAVSSQVKTSALPKAPAAIAKPAVEKKVEAAPLKPAPPVMQMPKLSHIVNLPRMEAGASKPPVAVMPKPAAVEKQPYVFGDKLKSIVSEKELAPGKPEFELELSALSADRPASLPGAAASDKKPSFISSFLSLAKAKPAEPLPSVPGLKDQMRPALPQVPKPLAKAAFVQPSSAPVKLLNIQPKPVASPLPAVVAPKEAVSVVKPEPPKSSPENLSDLAVLDEKILRNNKFEDLLGKMKGLIGKYGYHDVVFNLEKSPLYASYIKTGVELLSKQISFEQLNEQTKGENSLSRQQFETLADLLRQMQAG